MSSSTTASLPEVGQLVDVRYRRFVVTDVRKSQLSISNPSHLVTLSSVEDDAIGEELRVVWELELGAHTHEKVSLPDPTGFDDPKALDAFLNAVRWGAISPADDKILQAPFRSGIDIEEYQLDPVIRALRMPRANLLIADDVGLGKTIEAGLVIQELVLRNRIRSILIVCPASIQIQWKNQMRDKFGLEFRIIDSDAMKELRRKRGIRVNPWTHFPRLITSMDYLKRERPLRSFRETLPPEGQPIYPRRYDFMIVDEAHNVAPEALGNYATDSQRTQTIRALSPHFEHKLFLTATPHNGYPESFTALLELMDNQRFARGVQADKKQLDAVMIRRMKEELKFRPDGTRRFADREIMPLEVDYRDDEKKQHKLLKTYVESYAGKKRQESQAYATEFVFKILKKRLFSSPAAFLTTLRKHLKSLAIVKKSSTTTPALGALKRLVKDIDDDYANDEEYEETLSEAVQAATGVIEGIEAGQKKHLDALVQLAQKYEARPDSKAQQLIDWIKQNIKPKGMWSNERVLIFTEYRATQKWLHSLFASEGFAEDGRLVMLYGGQDEKERESIKAAFQADPNDSKVRILLATDAASEGIDLQMHCSKLIHYEIPWNPNRMEQRNGRLDRHGQKADKVLIHHFVGKGYSDQSETVKSSDLEGDLEFLMIAVRKIERMRQDLGKVGPVIASQVEDAMLGKRKALDTDRIEKNLDAVRKILKFERDIREQLASFRSQLEETKIELNVTPDNVRRVVEIGLSLSKQPALRETTLEGVSPVFEMPALTGSWALCAEGLLHPHTGKIRPIVFDYQLAKDRDDIVLIHLNHRLVQHCLRLLRAEIWSLGAKKNLHRLTIKVVEDKDLDVPVFVAYGRIVVLGGRHHRLHEEVIAAGGKWKDGRFSRLGVGDIQSIVGLPTSHDEASTKIKKSLIESWIKISGPLLSALEARAQDRTKGLAKAFDERVESESLKLRTVLEELAKTIKRELKEPAEKQLEFWTAPEKEQLELNLTGLKKRLEEIPQEIERETEAIRSRYKDPEPRLFPVAVTCFIPRSLAEMNGGFE